MRRRELAGWLVAGVLLMVAAARPGADEVRCKKLVIEDEVGVVRIVLDGDTKGNATISIVDRKGRPRVMVGCGPTGPPIIGTIDADGEIHAVAMEK